MRIKEAKRARATSASAARASAAKRTLHEITPEWWSYLYDVARGVYVGPLPPRVLKALERRGLVDAASGVTRKGYDRLGGRRGDPTGSLTSDETIDYYLALGDAPAWPKGARP